MSEQSSALSTRHPALKDTMKHTSKALLSLALTVSAFSVGSPSRAEASADSAAKAEPDASKVYDGLITRLNTCLKASKGMVAARDAEIQRLKKGTESAQWRVQTAREKYDEAQAGLTAAGADSARWQSKLEQQHALLKQDAVKLGAIIARGREISFELRAQAAELDSQTADVGIEADRLPETDFRRKRVTQMLTESAWTQNRAIELADLSATELDAPVAEVFDRATVSNTPRTTAPSFATPAEFALQTGMSFEQFRDATGKAQPVRVGQIKREGKTCDAWCSIDDPSGLRAKSGDLQMRCTGGSRANSGAGIFVISRWDNGKIALPASSRINELPCGS
jgi:hypothetical protein